MLAAAAETWRWKDANGVVHYSDRPVPGAERVSVVAPKPSSSPPQTRTWTRLQRAPRHRAATQPADRSVHTLRDRRRRPTTRPSMPSIPWRWASMLEPSLQEGHRHRGAAGRHGGGGLAAGRTDPHAGRTCCAAATRSAPACSMRMARRSAPDRRSRSTCASRRCSAPRRQRRTDSAPAAIRREASRRDGAARIIPRRSRTSSPPSCSIRCRPASWCSTAQLCPIYANVSAQDFMAVSLQAGARPALRRPVLRCRGTWWRCCAARSTDWRPARSTRFR